MTATEVKQNLSRLNAEMREQHRILMDESSCSDTVIRARKELARIHHDIAYTLDSLDKK